MLFESNYACGLNKSHAKPMLILMPMLTRTESTPTPVRGSRKFFQRGSSFENVFNVVFLLFFLFCFFLGGGVMRGERIQYHYKWAIIGPPAKRHLNGISLVCR